MMNGDEELLKHDNKYSAFEQVNLPHKENDIQLANFLEDEWLVKKEDVFKVAPGVYQTHRILRHNELLQSLHLLEVDLNNPYIDLIVSSCGGKVERLETVGNMQKELMETGKRVVAGVNGDFFSFLGVPSGLQIYDREIITSPILTKVLMAVMPNKKAIFQNTVIMDAKFENVSGYELSLDGINRTRYLKHNNHAFLYNWRFGESTRTPGGGIEVVISALNHGFFPKTRIIGVVESLLKASNTSIEAGKIILSATGKKADWLLENLNQGESVEIEVTYNKGINEAQQVLSGNSSLGFELLKDGQISKQLLELNDLLKSDRHPRTMLATKQGKLFAMLVDGRQPGHSDGITLMEGARYLQSIGMEAAINIDGGGSSTIYFRHPGDEKPILNNRPSDGFERAVGNAMFVVSTAPLSDLDSLVLLPKSPIKVLAGSQIKFNVKGQDGFCNPVAVKSIEVNWLEEGNIGSIQDTGQFFANKEAASGKVIISNGGIVQHCQVTIVDYISRLEVKPSSFVVEPGGEIELRAFAYDDKDNEIWLSPNLLDWKVDGDIGEVTPVGLFLANNTPAQGIVSVSYKNVETAVHLNVGKPPQLLADFESLEGMNVYGAGAVPGSVTLTKATRPQPVRFGTFSGKMTYDFTDISGSSKAVIQFFNDSGSQGLEVNGQPIRFGVWVYGDGNCHWLRLGIKDAHGESRSLNLTEPGGLNWIGWKYVHAEVSPNTAFPLTVHYLFLAETNDANKNAGVIYLDHFRAEYVNINEDVEGPEFSQPKPEQNSVHPTLRPEISVIVQDKGSGVNPSSIRMWLNGTIVNHMYQISTGKVSFQPRENLIKGKHQVIVEAADMCGNPMVPRACWEFNIKI